MQPEDDPMAIAHDASLDRRAGQRRRPVYIPPAAYLRTIWAILWTTFRHPLTTTLIDVTTGKVLRP